MSLIGFADRALPIVRELEWTGSGEILAEEYPRSSSYSKTLHTSHKKMVKLSRSLGKTRHPLNLLGSHSYLLFLGTPGAKVQVLQFQLFVHRTPAADAPFLILDATTLPDHSKTKTPLLTAFYPTWALRAGAVVQDPNLLFFHLLRTHHI